VDGGLLCTKILSSTLNKPIGGKILDKKLLQELLEDTDGRFQFGTQRAYDNDAIIDNGLLFFTIDTLRIYRGRVNYTEFVILTERLPKPKRAIPGKLYVDTTNKRLSVLSECGTEWHHIINGRPFSLILSEEEPTNQNDGDIWYEDLENEDTDSEHPPTVLPVCPEDCEEECDCGDCEVCVPETSPEYRDCEHCTKHVPEEAKPHEPARVCRLLSCDYCGRGTYGCIHTGGDKDAD
jgi:hypothetical protein